MCCVQEYGQGANEGGVFHRGGHIVLTGLGTIMKRHPAIVLLSKWLRLYSNFIAMGKFVSVDIKYKSVVLLIICAHMPSQHSCAEYTRALLLLEHIMTLPSKDVGFANKPVHCILGVDANEGLTPMFEFPTNPITELVGEFTTGRRGPCSVLFNEFVHANGLVAINTWAHHSQHVDRDAIYTWERGGAKNQKDFILVQADFLQGKDLLAQVMHDVTLPIVSDHRMLRVDIQVSPSWIKAKSTSSFGWQVRPAPHGEDFKDFVARRLSEPYEASTLPPFD